MKKTLILLAVILFGFQPVMAKNVKVQAMSDFTTANPPETWSVKIVEDFVTDNDYYIKAGSTIEGKIVDVTEPKRLKRNATFTFVPVKFYDISKGQTYGIRQNMVGKYSSMSGISAGSVAKQGAVIVGNKLVDGFFGPGVALVEGAVKNEQGNRAKSAAVSLYESTPLSYANKGKEMEIKKDQIFIMSFKTKDDVSVKNKPNYEYTMEE